MRQVSQYASEYVAHAANEPRDVNMTFDDVRRSMATAFRLFRWCYLVLTADGYLTPVPIIQHPGGECFNSRGSSPANPCKSTDRSMS